jgi:hypothetical protein
MKARKNERWKINGLESHESGRSEKAIHIENLKVMEKISLVIIRTRRPPKGE